MDAILTVTKRDLKGSSNARRMRRAGEIPGVIYSKGGETIEISILEHDFEKILKHHAGEQMMIQISLDGKTSSMLLKDLQRDMLRDGILHVDLQEVAMDETLTVQVSLELVGEPEGVKTEGGVLDQLLHHVEVECLPRDILEKIEADVSALKLGENLTVKDIELDSGKYEMITNGDVAVASVSAPRVAEEPVAGEEGAEGEGPEVINEKKEEAE